jgi:thioesterase domain-containing protein/acyl carrier protein
MVPAFFVTLAELPLTPNGKVDRRALPAPEHIRSESDLIYVPPQNVLERQLVKIWEEVLNLQPIGLKDNFFDLGGHSLLAVRLMSKLEQLVGEKLPLVTIFRAPTIEQLLRLLQQEVRSLFYSSLIEIQPSGSKPPLFFVHPAGGHVFRFLDMARLLGPDQPFYGLQSQGLEDQKEPFTEVDAMASHYIKALRTVQPDGPYSLGGWSMGGVVAFEMARQLQAKGQKIALLALVDTQAPNSKEKSIDDSNATLLIKYAQDLGLPLSALISASEHLPQLDQDVQLPYLFQQLSAAGILPSGIDLHELHRLCRVFRANVRAMQSYVPDPGSVRVTLFKATDKLEFPTRTLRLILFLSKLSWRKIPRLRKIIRRAVDDHRDQTMGWGKVAAKGVAVHEISGNHYSMMAQPNLETLAERLRAYLEEREPNTLEEPTLINITEEREVLPLIFQ